MKLNKDIRGFLVYVGPALLCAIIIFYLGTVRTPVLFPQSLWSKDKWNHCLAFGVFALSIQRAIRFEFAGLRIGIVLSVSAALSSIAGALLEFWQLFLGYRSAEVLDWVADTIGAILAGFVGLAWIYWRRQRES